jgi:hypothetical protein
LNLQYSFLSALLVAMSICSTTQYFIRLSGIVVVCDGNGLIEWSTSYCKHPVVFVCLYVSTLLLLCVLGSAI